MEIHIKDRSYKVPWEFIIAPFLVFLTAVILILSNLSGIKRYYIDYSDKVTSNKITSNEASPSVRVSSAPTEYREPAGPSEAPEESPASEPRTAPESGKVNINKAGMEELMALPYIGEVKAKAILSYRSEHGQFKSIDELENIKGIGTKTLEKLKPLVALE